MHLIIDGKRYQLIIAKRIYDKEHGELVGVCDAPNVPGKCIKIREDQKDLDLLETLIHECLHAACWCLSEEAVTTIAHDIAVMLWRLGYRVPDDWREKAGL